MPDNATIDPRSPAVGRNDGGGVQGLVDKAMLATLDRALRAYGQGCLHLTLPSGEAAVLGNADGGGEARLVLRSYGVLWRIARDGALGFAESYMDGEIDALDLRAVFDFFLANEAGLARAFPAIIRSRASDRRFHADRRNTHDGSRRNIAAHYDLGNDFYRLWLDGSMLYSSGIYANRASTLEDAQQLKLARILSALALAPGHRLLEIGCGWGALAEKAGRAGAQVDAITISEQQLAAACSRITAASLADRVEVRFEDYRDTRGQYDRLVSIEMIEAVGEENWPLYFSIVADRLAPGGRAVIQAITIKEEVFAHYRRNPDFIQRYIFPGGMLPTVPLMQKRAEAAGLDFETVERFGGSYALTLAEWRHRFEAAWPEIERLGFDERFRRMWLYYFTYCEVGFERGLIDVGIYRLSKAS